MSLYYIDTSAALKLLAEESHSHAFAAFYDKSADASWVSSALLRIEVIRAVSRVMPAALPDARALLLAFDYVSIDDDDQPGLAMELVPASSTHLRRGFHPLTRWQSKTVCPADHPAVDGGNCQPEAGKIQLSGSGAG